MAALKEIEIGDADADRLVEPLIGVEHDHRGHELGHRGDGSDRVGALGVYGLSRVGVKDKRVGRREPQLADVTGQV